MNETTAVRNFTSLIYQTPKLDTEIRLTRTTNYIVRYKTLITPIYNKVATQGESFISAEKVGARRRGENRPRAYTCHLLWNRQDVPTLSWHDTEPGSTTTVLSAEKVGMSADKTDIYFYISGLFVNEWDNLRNFTKHQNLILNNTIN